MSGLPGFGQLHLGKYTKNPIYVNGLTLNGCFCVSALTKITSCAITLRLSTITAEVYDQAKF